MAAPQQLSALQIDLTRLHRRTVTSFYSNLVTRPTGRAVRSGVERQLLETAAPGVPCLSILDFSQVRIMDYSCADEIVAKLLLRYCSAERPADAYFLARGLQDHHLEAVDVVLERHRLLLVAADPGEGPRLVGPTTPLERSCWNALSAQGTTTTDRLATALALPLEATRNPVQRLLEARAAVALPDGRICSLSVLADA
jgi:hypothetical protein